MSLPMMSAGFKINKKLIKMKNEKMKNNNLDVC